MKARFLLDGQSQSTEPSPYAVFISGHETASLAAFANISTALLPAFPRLARGGLFTIIPIALVIVWGLLDEEKLLALNERMGQEVVKFEADELATGEGAKQWAIFHWLPIPPIGTQCWPSNLIKNKSLIGR